MRLLIALLLLAGQAAADTPADPPWAGSAVGRYAGSVRNAGRMECHRTEFTLQDGKLVGHYWIDDADPFEGELTGFQPQDGTSGAGTFVWTDRYGTGVEFVVFAADFRSFTGAWGDTAPEWGNPVWGLRGGTAGCEAIVSMLSTPFMLASRDGVAAPPR